MSVAMSQLAATRWALDPSASRVECCVHQLWGLSTVRGCFTGFDGELELRASGAGRAELRIQAATVDTGNRRRDRHLRAPAYFDCARHPLVRVAAVAVPAPDGGLLLHGDLETAGRATVLDLVATVEHRGDRLELAAAVEIDARELGMMWSPLGSPRTPATLSVLACLRREP
jgi:polyisoprenoid-binding protein YceI